MLAAAFSVDVDWKSFREQAVQIKTRRSDKGAQSVAAIAKIKEIWTLQICPGFYVRGSSETARVYKKWAGLFEFVYGKTVEALASEEA